MKNIRASLPGGLAKAGALALLTAGFAQAQQSKGTDQLTFGNAASEKSHQLTAENSQVIVGGLAEPARTLLPLATPNWQGGKLSCVMAVDPTAQNYVTLRLWGSDVNHNRLVLLCDGKQVGYRHLGDIDLLDLGSDAPLTQGRFYYTTLPLPLQSTKGKKSVQLTLQSNGPFWAYGGTWEAYQKPMTEPTRGLYRLYTHTEGFLPIPASEKQGTAPQPATRPGPGPEVLVALQQRVNKELTGLLKSAKPLSQVQLQLLAKAYEVSWSVAYHNPAVVQQVQRGLDTLYLAYKQNPRLAESDILTYNPDWFGLGICGQVIALLHEPLRAGLDQPLAGAAGTRRAAYAQMLRACRDWHRQHRRLYTNQSMINDLYGIYYANKGLAQLVPAAALPEATVRRYLYESVGLEPWLGSEDAQGQPNKLLGNAYFQTTAKGLTKELGFVGNYGEVLDWVSEIYEATQPAPGQPGDERLRAQLDKIALARIPFRYQTQDSAGYRAMRAETLVGWRDHHYPGDVTYVQRPTWDGGPLQTVTATGNAKLVGYARQQLADNQFFAAMQERMRVGSFRVTAGLLPTPGQYAALQALPASDARMPMSAGAPDFVFADEEDGVVAVKHGAEYFYASVYWRARNAVNFLGRVHLVTPTYDRIATVAEEEEFEPSGNFFTRPNYTNFGFANGGIKYPETVQSAHAGERLPIAKIPADVAYKPGQESSYAGRASFYRLHYGKYLVGLNATADKSYELKIPAGFGRAVDAATGRPVGTATSVTVGPRSTVVLVAD